MKVITPFDINDTVMSNNIPEPDADLGEVEWEANRSNILLNVNDLNTGPGLFVYSIVINDDFYYALDVRTGSIVKYDIDGTNLGAIYTDSQFSSGALTFGDGFFYLYYSYTATESSTLDIRKIDINGVVVDTFSISLEFVVETQLLRGMLAYSDGFLSLVYSNEDTGGVTNPTIFRVFEYDVNSKVKVVDKDITSIIPDTDSFFVAGICKVGDVTYIANSKDRTMCAMDSDYSSLEVVSTPSSFIQQPAGGLFVYNDAFWRVDTDFSTGSAENVVKRLYLDFSYGGYYQTGDRVIKQSSHKLYQAASNNPDDPEIGVDKVPPTWTEISATNKYRAFDYVINTKAEYDDSLEYVLAFDNAGITVASAASNLAIFGMENISSVRVVARVGSETGSIIYDQTKDLAIASPFEDSISNYTLFLDKALFDDLPISHPSGFQIFIIVTFNATNSSENIFVGDIVAGNSREIGVATYQTSTSRTSYDTVDIDTFGNEKITSRPSAEYTSFAMIVEPEYANYVERILKDSLNKPRVYVGDMENDEKIFTFGYYERNPIVYSSPTQYETTLKVRGLV